MEELKINTENNDLPFIIDLYKELYKTYQSQSHWAKATNVGEVLVKLDPNNELFYQWLGTMYRRRKNSELATINMRKSLDLKLNSKLDLVISQIEDSINIGETPIQSSYKVLESGGNNLGVIEHIVGEKVYYTKIIEKEKIRNEGLFYKEIRNDHKILQQFTPNLLNIKEYAGIIFMTIEKVNGSYPKKSHIDDILTIFKDISSLRYEDVIHYFPHTKKETKLAGKLGLTNVFSEFHSKETNSEVFEWLYFQRNKRKYSDKTVNLIKRIEHLIMDNKLYEMLDPKKHYSFLHGDFHTQNILYDEKNDKYSVIDWAYCGLAPVGCDLVKLFRRLKFSFKQIDIHYLSNPSFGQKLENIQKIFFVYALILTWFNAFSRNQIENHQEEYLIPAIAYLENLVQKGLGFSAEYEPLKIIEEKPEKTQKEEVFRIENLGVSFLSGQRSDDYKSHVFNLFQKSKKRKTRDLIWPLRNIDLVGYKGEVLGIIGSNGSGKTTLCKVLSGILKPDEGKVTVDGRVSALFSLGMGFNKELSGRENVYLNGMMLGIEKSKIQHFIEEIREFSGIGDFIDQPVKTYSSGMRARLGFSVASFLEPEILILDESLNTGDEEFSIKAAKKMKELVQKAKMVILVTHSLKYAEKNCDRLVWLDKGIVRDIGEPDYIIDAYRESIPFRKRKKKKKIELRKLEHDVKDSTIIKADNVSVYYNMNRTQHWALKNINFEIKQGEVVGIIGHNGAGKSTLCRLLTNILSPDEGNLFVDGETTALLGYGTGFNAQLTGRDNIFLNGLLLGIPKKKVEENFEEIVNFSELGKFIDKPVKQYSSGMQSRLGFSIAATLQPDIFIIDEALSTGDMAFKRKASDKIQEIMEKSKAVLIVSHSMGFVEKVCTRAIWVNKGEILFDGDPNEAIERYKQHVKELRMN
ncbi:ATP-binding cassette domain-containing protein [Evansella sp. AB-P1]|uniref:ATP-binding cassette domain-containing protein n=1 Tax=Evansella sp. AB-P1 TaxID=3037653 RepID=UPI00241ED0F3|nr:ATP-binding cassette domain-containing protein [Evansella sp. AB-P1]MDG5786700.1 ATP-binding cassette domain-containing protein [Evansella sp. AB-P1]